MTTTLAPTTSLDTLTAGLASLVWWNFSGTQLTPDQLRHRVTVAGMDASTVPSIDPTQAVTQAVREFRIHEGKKVTMEAQIALEDADHIVVNLLRLTQQARERVAKLPVDELVWDKAGKCWLSTGVTAEADKLRDLALELATFYDGNAVRDLLVVPALEAASSFSLRRGMHVVPHATCAPVTAMQAAIAGLDGFTVSVAQVAAQQGWEAPLAEASRAELRNDLDELREQIEGWRSMAKRVRSDTQEHVLARFTQLAQRAALYSEALAVSMEDIAADVASMEAMALEVIEGKDAEAEGRKAERAPAAVVVTAGDARRTALAAMSSAQLATLWGALGDGEQPADAAVLVEALACAMEAAAA